MRRALPPAVGMAAHLGRSPEDGLSAVVPEDAAWCVRATPTSTGWRIDEVHSLGSVLGEQSVRLADTSADEAPQLITDHFRRLQREVRNAACGTPTTAPPAV